MPAPSSMTFAVAATEVLTRIGQLDDGVANPLLVMEAKAHINAAQRKLIVEHGLQSQRRALNVSVAGGRRFVDLPKTARRGQIMSATWTDAAGLHTPLACGIAATSRNAADQAPAWYDVNPNVGIVSVTATGGSGYASGTGTVTGGTRESYGHDPVVMFTVSGGAVTAAEVIDTGSGWTVAPTITPPGGGTGATVTVTLDSVQLVELCPIPAAAGTLAIEYKAAVVKLVDDADLLALDDEAVISRAALLLAVTKSLRCKADIESDFVSYMASFRAQQTPGRTFSLAAWRRDVPEVSTFRGR
jgi:hypothetical protein